ncbi:hypothetical protein HELRODRAFT_158869 [Helobdella robusta]|uniref:Endonuclease/exonuclease/phosphatase domain-containing protein n=1 Tax=Helobdella robusta TaxID=6412 RepID=T1ENC7_HELRO|nr:hypothetical protein HELRODRAFT_158869 [Helobdella robusta]ESO12360.1 hypothetical protein HELRODRAFT_158869 [Helobdella robusta]
MYFSLKRIITLRKFRLKLACSVCSDKTFIICGDFNAPPPLFGIDHHLSSLLESFYLTQHVSSSTHVHGNSLDLVITHTNNNVVDNLTVNDCVFSDHNIVCFNIVLFKPPSTIIHSCRRSFRRLNYTSFENGVNRTFDDLLSQDLERYSFRESSHPRCSLSQEAIAVKRNCRRMERHYKHDKSVLNFVNYKNAKRVARDAIMRSWIDSIKNTLYNCLNSRDL